MRCTLLLSFLLSACASSGLSVDRAPSENLWAPPAFRADHTGLAASTGNEVVIPVDVPVGTTILYAATRGGAGDADLEVRLADGTLLCASRQRGNDEVCVVWDPPEGSVDVALVAYQGFSGLELDTVTDGAEEEEELTEDTAVPAPGPCPPDMVHIEGFCIDRYEAYLADQSPFQVPSSGVAENAEGAIPQGYISGHVAADACEAAGKRLCSSSEWVRACKGPDDNVFPYGNSYQPGACNEGRSSHPVIEVFGSGATWSGTQMNSPLLNQLVDSLAPSGAYDECVTAEGVYDMHGNLHEWVADAAGTFRGGFYVDASVNGTGCNYRTTAHHSAYHDYSTGFRCCTEPSL